MVSNDNIVASTKANEQAVTNKSESAAVIKRKHIDISIIIAVLSLVISVLSFLFATFPQLNPFNSNIVEKANAGDLKSQLMLAEHYYEISDTAESIYWYKIASAQESAYQAMALNNLAYIYANVDSLAEWDRFTLVKAYKIFLKAGEMGEPSAYRNAYILLHKIPEDVLIIEGNSLQSEKEKIKEILEASGMFSKELKDIQYSLEYVGPSEDLIDYDFDDSSKYVQVAIESELKTVQDDHGNPYPVWYTKYNTYKVVKTNELPQYTYLHISQETP